MVFVDTGAWFAYFVRRDSDHSAAIRWMKENQQPLVTTDYVLDELLALLRIRESHRVAVAAGDLLRTDRVAHLERVSADAPPTSANPFCRRHSQDNYERGTLEDILQTPQFTILRS